MPRSTVLKKDKRRKRRRNLRRRTSSHYRKQSSETEEEFEASSGTSHRSASTEEAQEELGHYGVLGILSTASASTIRSAYRRKALLTHPDKGGNAEEFIRVLTAFEVLSDEVKRAEYDTQLKADGSVDGRESSFTDFDPSLDHDTDESGCSKQARGDALAARALLLIADPKFWPSMLQDLTLQTLKALIDVLNDVDKKGTKVESANTQNEEKDEVQEKDHEPAADVTTRGIFTSRSGSKSKYSVNVNWNGFRIHTKQTFSLAEAISWHIALSDAKEAAQKRLRRVAASQRQLRSRSRGGRTDFSHVFASGEPALSMDEYIGILKAEPSISLCFKVDLSANSYRWATRQTNDLKMASAMHRFYYHKVASREEMTPVIMQKAKESFAERGARDAEQMEITRQQLLELTANVVEARRKQHVLEGRSRLKRLLPPKEPIKKEERVDSTSNVEQIARAATTELDTRSSPPKPRKARRTELPPCRVQQAREECANLALDLVVALGLDQNGIRTLTEHVRQLSPAEIRRRLEVFSDNAPLALTPEGEAQHAGNQFDGDRVLARHQPQSLSTSTAIALRHQSSAAALPSSERRLRALRHHSSSSSSSAPIDSPSSSRLGNVFLRRQLRSGRMLAIEAIKPCAPREIPEPYTISQWILDLAQWMPTIIEVGHMRCVCKSFLASANRELATCFQTFTYSHCGFQPSLVPATRSERERRPRAEARGNAAARFVGLVRHKFFQPFFEELDVTDLPHSALQTQDFQKALLGMTNLELLILPSTGWETAAQRVRFRQELPSRIEVRFQLGRVLDG